MHRIDSYDATPDHKFTEGNPTIPVPATTVTADWLNATQEEVATCIEAAGIILDKADNRQLMRAIALLAAGGRVQKAWVIDAALPEGGTLNLPPEVAYTVGGGALLLAWDGVQLNDRNFAEMGQRGEKSTLIKLLFAAPAGSEFHAVHTAAGGGALVAAIPHDLRQAFEASIARADAAAQTAEAAAARVGDPFYAQRG